MFHTAAVVAATIAIAYQASEERRLATLTPEERTAYLARQREARERESLESSPEVLLARRYIASDDLRGEHAERLLTFARDLARRRAN